MNTRIFTPQLPEHGMEQLKEAGDIIKAGGLVAFPTETVYGLGGDGLNPQSAQKIYAAKGRPSDNPLIIHICTWDSIEDLVSREGKEQGILQLAKKLANAFWPGPLTMVLPKSPLVPMETTGGLSTVAVRMPRHDIALELIKQSGGYVAAPSANTSGKPSPTLAKHVLEDMNGNIDLIIDGGLVGIGLESTIIDLTSTPPTLLRPGFITLEELTEVLGNINTDPTILNGDSLEAPKAPGMKYRHYAPKGELTIIEGSAKQVVDKINTLAKKQRQQGLKVGVIGTQETVAKYEADCVKSLGCRKDENDIARHLYCILREFDEENISVIYSEAFQTIGIGQAIMNRLLKAAGHKILKFDEEKKENDSNR